MKESQSQSTRIFLYTGLNVFLPFKVFIFVKIWFSQIRNNITITLLYHSFFLLFDGNEHRCTLWSFKLTHHLISSTANCCLYPSIDLHQCYYLKHKEILYSVFRFRFIVGFLSSSGPGQSRSGPG